MMLVDSGRVSTLEKEAAGSALARQAIARIQAGEKSILSEDPSTKGLTSIAPFLETSNFDIDVLGEKWKRTVVWPQAYPVETARNIKEEVSDLLAEGPLAWSRDELTLNGTYWDTDGQEIAIVNGKLLRVGDSYQGARVVSVQTGMAELSRFGRTIMLEIK